MYVYIVYGIIFVEAEDIELEDNEEVMLCIRSVECVLCVVFCNVVKR